MSASSRSPDKVEIAMSASSGSADKVEIAMSASSCSDDKVEIAMSASSCSADKVESTASSRNSGSSSSSSSLSADEFVVPSSDDAEEIPRQSVDKYTCEICSCSFWAIQDFEEHGSIHLPDRPFACDCDNCCLVFASESHLNFHRQKEHTDQFPEVRKVVAVTNIGQRVRRNKRLVVALLEL